MSGDDMKSTCKQAKEDGKQVEDERTGSAEALTWENGFGGSFEMARQLLAEEEREDKLCGYIEKCCTKMYCNGNDDDFADRMIEPTLKRGEDKVQQQRQQLK